MRLITLVCICLGMASLAIAGAAPRGGRIAWEKDLKRGMKEAASSDRPAMLYFTDDR